MIALMAALLAIAWLSVSATPMTQTSGATTSSVAAQPSSSADLASRIDEYNAKYLSFCIRNALVDVRRSSIALAKAEVSDA